MRSSRPSHVTTPRRAVRRFRHRRSNRRGYVLVWFSLALALLMGLVGLVVDGGMLSSTYRQARNAADAAAMAAAQEVLHGRSSAPNLQTTAETFVHNYNGLAGATVV